MSWDVLIVNVPAHIKSDKDLPEDFESNLGSADDIRSLLESIFPDIDLSDPTWGVLEGADFSIEFSMGEKTPVDELMLHVRGSDAAIEPIRKVCEAGKWRALDLSDGEYLDFSGSPEEGLDSWREFRDQVVSQARASGAEVTIDEKVGGVQADAVNAGSEAKKWWQFWK